MKIFSANNGLRMLFYSFVLASCPPGTLARAHASPPHRAVVFQQVITGTVSDSSGPLPGATIWVKGTSVSTASDMDGKFTITASTGDMLVFSFTGYTTLEMPVGTQSVVNITLEQDNKQLDEVIINAGYYAVKDKERTGSTARITSEDIEKQPVGNVLATMQGRMAGVNITQTTGVPGGGFDILIRGQNSLRGEGNSPLYIIDGVPYSSQSTGNAITSVIIPGDANPLSNLNPQEIESIELLKDADATAIYGSRGANGVVLITTKKGKAGKVTYSGTLSSGFGKVTRFMDLMNTQQYLQMRAEAFANDGITEYPANAYDLNGTWDPSRYTYWQKELLGGTAGITQVNLSASGGSEQTRFLLTGNYRSESTVFPGDFEYRRKGLRFAVNHDSKDKRFSLSFTAGYSLQDNNQPGTDLTFDALRLAPNAPALYNPDGSLNWENSTWDNPLRTLEGKYLSNSGDLIANAVLTWKLWKGISFRSNLGFTDLNYKESNTSPSTIYNPAYGAGPEFSSIYVSNTARRSWIAEPQLSWQGQLGNLEVNALLGTTFQELTNSQLVQSGTGFTSNALIYNLAAAATKNILNNEQSVYKYQAGFARLNLNWQGKYIVNLTGRRDGSSRFGPERRFANFGAVGMAWLFSREGFLSESSILSFGKLRGSYGTSGNDQIGDCGRFIINTDLEVVKLDKNTLKINYYQGSGTDTDYFEILDDKGNKYRFDVREKTTQQTWHMLNFFGGGTASPYSIIPEYTSAYHLSTVKSKTNAALINFYYTQPQKEQIKNTQRIAAQIINLDQGTVLSTIGQPNPLTGEFQCGFPPNEFQKLQPELKRTVNELFMETKKIDHIIVNGKAKFTFGYEVGRSDYNIVNGNLSSKLKTIIVSRHVPGAGYISYKKFTLNYFYSNVASMGARLMLEDVVESNYTDTKTLKHSFYYDDYYKHMGLNFDGEISHDYWGYFNNTPYSNPRNKEVSPIVCATDMLQKIEYPTGGCTVFDYEPNTYSYIGHQALNDHNADLETSEFNPNPDNWSVDTESVVLSADQQNDYTDIYEFAATVGQPQFLTIRATVTENSSLRLEKLISGQWQLITNINNTTYDVGELYGFYRLKYTNLTIGTQGDADVWFHYKTRLTPTRKWLYGGGVRIKRIGYFDQSVDPYYYRDSYIASQEPAPVKEKNYSYQFFNDTWRSSGSMVTPRPIFTDTVTRTYVAGNTPLCDFYPYFDFEYRFDYSSSIAAEVQSQGGYVGYKNVTVSETGNGRTTYEYSSSIDVPEDETTSTYPYFPIATHDYKKGNLLAERVYNEAGQKLQETIYEYDPAAMQEFTEVIGLQVYGNKDKDCPGASNFTTYGDYMNAVDQCANNGPSDPLCQATCGTSDTYISYKKSFQHFGWVKLTRKINREYFYDDSGQHLIESIEDFTYNNLNMKVASYKKQVYSGSSPEFIEMQYSYHLPPGYTTSNRISDIAQVKTYRNGSEISLRSITYNGNAPYLPFTVSASKAGEALEERVRFKAYNEYGNILEVQQTDGNTISYIWGYNKSQPIAMIENASNAQIALSLGVNYSDINEANITAINNLRTALPDAMITTYTHEPLIGIKTMTDPRGYTTSYTYDPFGRLISVKDDQGNLLSENKYNFRP